MNKKPKEIMLELHKKFILNFESWCSISNSKIEKTFNGLQCIAAVGEVLAEKSMYKHHELCVKIFDEIFSDGVAAIYLATIAMDKPSNVVLRRLVELGVAAIYLWDMPHMVYLWNDDSQDLKFTEMLNHLSSKGYLAYVNCENSSKITPEGFPLQRLQSVYWRLSDTVHGKICTFESSVPDRFKFVETEWCDFAGQIQEVIEILVCSFIIRFDISEEVFRKVPQAKKEFNLQWQ